MKNTPLYESCIKINGVSILPPLITREKRAQLIEYKQKAIELEEQLSAKKHAEDEHFYRSRSNPYVLDMPSDALLEYLSKQDDESSSKEQSLSFSDETVITVMTHIPPTTTTLSLSSSDSENSLPEETISENKQTSEMFGEQTDETLQYRAAAIITAAVRGYLTRRLNKTEEAQRLLKTIRDCLLCAIGVHSDAKEVIDENVVEFHRRLIGQVSNACAAYYGLFMDTPIASQMKLIAQDRKHQQIKLKRRQRKGL